MKIGIPKEIKEKENRVAVTPEGTRTLIRAGHEVLVETGAGVGSGFATTVWPTCRSLPAALDHGPNRGHAALRPPPGP